MRDDLERERKTATLLRAIRFQRARSSAESLHAQLAILRAANDGTAETVSILRLDNEMVRRRIDELETEPREAEMGNIRVFEHVRPLLQSNGSGTNDEKARMAALAHISYPDSRRSSGDCA
ncbi:hypothetical protein BGY98DRAFT_1097980 [Russula aff. rugulosa BPL654]|nr:hypothetical protein BGY98DRAFT_1097980 [Russula aff. rugulosa BPL654]